MAYIHLCLGFTNSFYERPKRCCSLFNLNSDRDHLQMINTTWVYEEQLWLKGCLTRNTIAQTYGRFAGWFIVLIKEKPQCFEPWHHLHWQRFVALIPVSYDLSLCERFIVHLGVAPEFWCGLWDEMFLRRGQMSTINTLSFFCHF